MRTFLTGSYAPVAAARANSRNSMVISPNTELCRMARPFRTILKNPL